MKEDTENLPVMLFDGDCGFCRRWIRKWRIQTGDRVRYAPYQQAMARYPQLTEQQCAAAVQLILPDGTVFSGAHAVFRALDLGGRYPWLLRLYEKRPWFATVAEWFYQLVAHHRVFFSRIS
jgi:predicted DCC family thiol-disulfide oxidoreductase YuxK